MENKRNCITCKFHISCKMLADNEEYQKINGSFPDGLMERCKFRKNFICDNYKSRYIEYPIEVSRINRNTERYCLDREDIARFVSIRPCGEEYQDKTYLGLFLGDLPIGHHISHNPETKELNISFLCNPAIFVFDLKKIIYGCESWWGVIENEKDLRQISNADINNTWYVRVLRGLEQVSEDVEETTT